jgi:hypothetical protein
MGCKHRAEGRCGRGVRKGTQNRTRQTRSRKKPQEVAEFMRWSLINIYQPDFTFAIMEAGFPQPSVANLQALVEFLTQIWIPNFNRHRNAGKSVHARSKSCIRESG